MKSKSGLRALHLYYLALFLRFDVCKSANFTCAETGLNGYSLFFPGNEEEFRTPVQDGLKAFALEYWIRPYEAVAGRAYTHLRYLSAADGAEVLAVVQQRTTLRVAYLGASKKVYEGGGLWERWLRVLLTRAGPGEPLKIRLQTYDNDDLPVDEGEVQEEWAPAGEVEGEGGEGLVLPSGAFTVGGGTLAGFLDDVFLWSGTVGWGAGDGSGEGVVWPSLEVRQSGAPNLVFGFDFDAVREESPQVFDRAGGGRWRGLLGRCHGGYAFGGGCAAGDGARPQRAPRAAPTTDAALQTAQVVGGAARFQLGCPAGADGTVQYVEAPARGQLLRYVTDTTLVEVEEGAALSPSYWYAYALGADESCLGARGPRNATETCCDGLRLLSEGAECDVAARLCFVANTPPPAPAEGAECVVTVAALDEGEGAGAAVCAPLGADRAAVDADGDGLEVVLVGGVGTALGLSLYQVTPSGDRGAAITANETALTDPRRRLWVEAAAGAAGAAANGTLLLLRFSDGHAASAVGALAVAVRAAGGGGGASPSSWLLDPSNLWLYLVGLGALGGAAGAVRLVDQCRKWGGGEGEGEGGGRWGRCCWRRGLGARGGGAGELGFKRSNKVLALGRLGLGGGGGTLMRETPPGQGPAGAHHPAHAHGPLFGSAGLVAAAHLVLGGGGGSGPYGSAGGLVGAAGGAGAGAQLPYDPAAHELVAEVLRQQEAAGGGGAAGLRAIAVLRHELTDLVLTDGPGGVGRSKHGSSSAGAGGGYSAGAHGGAAGSGGPGGHHLAPGGGGGGRGWQGRYRGAAVAVREVPARSAPGVARALRGALAQRALHHPNVELLVGLCAEGGLFTVHEAAERGALWRVLREAAQGPRPMSWHNPKWKMAVDIARGMLYLHSTYQYDESTGEHRSSIVHGDLSCDNLLVTHQYGVKIRQFAQRNFSPLQNHSAEIQAAALHVAPELLRGEAADEKADVFSFAVVLLELALPPAAHAAPHPAGTTGAEKAFRRAYLRANHATHSPSNKKHRTVSAHLVSNAVVFKNLRPDLQPLVDGQPNKLIESRAPAKKPAPQMAAAAAAGGPTPRSLCQLIEMCWHPDPSFRPSFKQILRDLEEPIWHEVFVELKECAAPLPGDGPSQAVPVEPGDAGMPELTQGEDSKGEGGCTAAQPESNGAPPYPEQVTAAGRGLRRRSLQGTGWEAPGDAAGAGQDAAAGGAWGQQQGPFGAGVAQQPGHQGRVRSRQELEGAPGGRPRGGGGSAEAPLAPVPRHLSHQGHAPHTGGPLHWGGRTAEGHHWHDRPGPAIAGGETPGEGFDAPPHFVESKESSPDGEGHETDRHFNKRSTSASARYPKSLSPYFQRQDFARQQAGLRHYAPPFRRMSVNEEGEEDMAPEERAWRHQHQQQLPSGMSAQHANGRQVLAPLSAKKYQETGPQSEPPAGMARDRTDHDGHSSKQTGSLLEPSGQRPSAGAVGREGTKVHHPRYHHWQQGMEGQTTSQEKNHHTDPRQQIAAAQTAGPATGSALPAPTTFLGSPETGHAQTYHPSQYQRGKRGGGDHGGTHGVTQRRGARKKQWAVGGNYAAGDVYGNLHQYQQTHGSIGGGLAGLGGTGGEEGATTEGQEDLVGVPQPPNGSGLDINLIHKVAARSIHQSIGTNVGHNGSDDDAHMDDGSTGQGMGRGVSGQYNHSAYRPNGFSGRFSRTNLGSSRYGGGAAAGGGRATSSNRHHPAAGLSGSFMGAAGGGASTKSFFRSGGRPALKDGEGPGPDEEGVPAVATMASLKLENKKKGARKR